MTLKIYIASDHAGFHLKNYVLSKLENYSLDDLGTYSEEAVDYPDYAHNLSNKVLADKHSKGILICGSGIGMSISANRHKGIRAALCHNCESAKFSRLHNDSNVLVLGARFINEEKSLEIINKWLDTEFEGGRHKRRIDRIDS